MKSKVSARYLFIQVGAEDEASRGFWHEEGKDQTSPDNNEGTVEKVLNIAISKYWMLSPFHLLCEIHCACGARYLHNHQLHLNNIARRYI